ncbi:MAG: fused MFS/spermidine synthase [Candidatus Gottesmanbacteria bacterium]
MINFMKFRHLLYILFPFSGFSALVYEVIWARQLGLVFGNTIYAISTILTIFFIGLAVGSYIFGRVVDFWDTRPRMILVIYGLIEIGIGLYAFITPFIFKTIEIVQDYLVVDFGGSSGFKLMTFGLCILGLIIPTMLMGATYPVITRLLSHYGDDKWSIMGNLYGLNTLGGVIGACLAGFYLISNLGIKETIFFAAVINILIGIIIFIGGRGQGQYYRVIGNKQRELVPSPYSLVPVLVVFFLSGFTSLALEVIWTRILILTFGGSTYAFTVILTVFLLGIALGSILTTKFLLSLKNSLAWLILFEILIGIIIILTTAFLDKLPLLFLNIIKTNPNINFWVSIIISILVILPITTLMGLIFPLALKILTPSFTTLGKDLGRIYGLNTLGGVLGSLAAGFFIIPFLGMQKGMISIGVVYLLSAAILINLSLLGRGFKLATILALILLSGFGFLMPTWNKNFLSSGVFIYYQDYLKSGDIQKSMSQDKILYYKEGLSATITVGVARNNTYLRIDGKTDASSINDLETMLLSGHLPMLLHPNPQEVLVIGLGSGITLGAVEQYEPARVDLVEIEPAVIEAARYFKESNHNALNYKNLFTYTDDGRHFLLNNKKKYDVISSEPSNPWVKGNANLFTQEYYQLVKNRLNKGGIFFQWIQLYYLDKENLKTVLATLHSVFPEITVWSPLFTNDLLIIAVDDPLLFDLTAIEKKLQKQGVKADLARIDISSSADILGLFSLDNQAVEALSAGAKLHTDNLPILEFLAPLSLGKETVGANLKLIASSLIYPQKQIINRSPLLDEKMATIWKAKENIINGRIELARFNFNQAINYYLEALSLSPEKKIISGELAKIYFYQAELFYSQNDLERAHKALTSLIGYDPKNVDAHLNLGAIYYRQGNIHAALNEWAIAKDLDPDSQEADQNLKLIENTLK